MNTISSNQLLKSPQKIIKPIEIEFPIKSTNDLSSTMELLIKFLTDGILLLANGIAILCILKFIISLINGFATKSYMGTSIMEDTSFIGRTDWNKKITPITPRRNENLDWTFK